MDNQGIDWGGLGSFLTDTAKATASVTDAFKGQQRTDLTAAQTKSNFQWQPIALALGGVVVVALLLKFAFRK